MSDSASRATRWTRSGLPPLPTLVGLPRGCRGRSPAGRRGHRRPEGPDLYEEFVATPHRTNVDIGCLDRHHWVNVRIRSSGGIGRYHPYREPNHRRRGDRLAVTSTAVDLLEREVGIGVLTAALDAATDGTGKLIVVSAEAGGGKTALLRTFVDSASPARILWGGCDDLVTPIPFGPLLDLSRTTDPGLEQALLDGERDRAFTRLLDLLE